MSITSHRRRNMKIITVKTPAFKWNDGVYQVSTQKIENENPFEKIQEIINQKEKDGNTHCFIFSISSAIHEIDGDSDDVENSPFLIRWAFAKIEPTEEIKLGRNLKAIEKILRGENNEVFKEALQKIILDEAINSIPPIIEKVGYIKKTDIDVENVPIIGYTALYYSNNDTLDSKIIPTDLKDSFIKTFGSNIPTGEAFNIWYRAVKSTT